MMRQYNSSSYISDSICSSLLSIGSLYTVCVSVNIDLKLYLLL